MSISRAYLNRTGVAALLGVSPVTVSRWIANRSVPFIKLGGRTGKDGSRGKGARVIFRRTDVEAWASRHTIHPS